MELKTKRSALPTKLVERGTVSDQPIRTVPQMMSRTAAVDKKTSDVKKVFDSTVSQRGRRLRQMVDQAIKTSDETRTKARSGKVSVTA